DSLRFRADSKINEINRSAAHSFTGTGLVDADAIFAKESQNSIIGSDLVYEHVHLTPRGSYVLARAMFLEIANQISRPGHSLQADDVPSQAECERLLAFTKFDHSRVTNEMLRRLQEPPFTNQLNHSDQLLRLMMKADNSDESPEDTTAQYQWALA